MFVLIYIYITFLKLPAPPRAALLVTMIFQYDVNTKPPKSGIRCGGEIDELLCVFFLGNF